MTFEATHVLLSGDRAIVPRLAVARGFFGRGLGLMGRTPLPPGYGLYLAPCRDLHTCFMRFAIDVIFLATDGRVVRTARGVRPWRLVFGGREARAAVEVAAGWLAADAVRPGERLRVSVSSPAGAPPRECPPPRSS